MHSTLPFMNRTTTSFFLYMNFQKDNNNNKNIFINKKICIPHGFFKKIWHEFVLHHRCNIVWIPITQEVVTHKKIGSNKRPCRTQKVMAGRSLAIFCSGCWSWCRLQLVQLRFQSHQASICGGWDNHLLEICLLLHSVY